jgi:hypothetical protein
MLHWRVESAGVMWRNFEGNRSFKYSRIFPQRCHYPSCHRIATSKNSLAIRCRFTCFCHGQTLISVTTSLTFCHKKFYFCHNLSRDSLFLSLDFVVLVLKCLASKHLNGQGFLTYLKSDALADHHQKSAKNLTRLRI